MEVLGLLFVLAVFYVGFKLLWLIFKVGVFAIVLPIKILLGLIVGFLCFIIIPLAVIPAVLAITIPFLPFILIGLGIIALFRLVF